MKFRGEWNVFRSLDLGWTAFLQIISFVRSFFFVEKEKSEFISISCWHFLNFSYYTSHCLFEIFLIFISCTIAFALHGTPSKYISPLSPLSHTPGCMSGLRRYLSSRREQLGWGINKENGALNIFLWRDTGWVRCWFPVKARRLANKCIFVFKMKLQTINSLLLSGKRNENFLLLGLISFSYSGEVRGEKWSFSN